VRNLIKPILSEVDRGHREAGGREEQAIPPLAGPELEQLPDDLGLKPLGRSPGGLAGRGTQEITTRRIRSDPLGVLAVQWIGLDDWASCPTPAHV